MYRLHCAAAFVSTVHRLAQPTMFARLSILLYASNFISLGYAKTHWESFVVHLANDGFYDSAGQFSIGQPEATPPVALKALFDTGTFHLWTVYPGSSIQGEHSSYDGTKSTKYSTDRTPLSEPFSGSTIDGHVATDIVQLGSQEYGITLQEQKFGEATSVGAPLQGLAFATYDAIFGLDLISEEELNGMPPTPLMNMAANFEPAPLFGVFMNRYSAQGGSQVVFGNKDDAFHTAQFTKHDVVKRSNGHYRGWNVEITKVEVEHVPSRETKEVQHAGPQTNGLSRLMTRSTALLLGPTEFIKNINEEVFGRYSTTELPLDRTEYTFPCKSSVDHITLFLKLPNLHIYIKNIDNGVTKFTFRPQDYVGITLDDSMCRSTIYGMDIEYFIMGTPFMNKYYTKFDYENKQVLFSPAKHGTRDIHVSELNSQELDAYRETARQLDDLRAQQKADAVAFYNKQDVTYAETVAFLHVRSAAEAYYGTTPVTNEQISAYVAYLQQ